jgi:single-stranded DNA-specific DHH superfamily exonuclease
MMTPDRHDDRERGDIRSDARSYQMLAATRSLQEAGVDVTGSESASELTLMQAAVEEFRRAAEALAGRAVLSASAEERTRQVIPPRAADETPRQYAERVSRMADRFRSLAQSPGRDRGTR